MCVPGIPRPCILPATTLQKLLEAHEEQNVDSYTEAVSVFPPAPEVLSQHPTSSKLPKSCRGSAHVRCWQWLRSYTYPTPHTQGHA